MEIEVAKAKVRKPRIRKSAPTMRERAESQQGKPKQQASRISRFIRRLLRPLRVFEPIFRPVKRLLAWITPTYFKNSWKEMQQVTWPSRRETWRLTLAVFIFATIFGIIIYGVDIGLDKIFKKVVLK